MTDEQAINLIFGLITGTYAGQMALMYAILSTLMTLIKRWDKLDFLFNNLPKPAKSYVPMVLGGLIGLCQGLIIYTTPQLLGLYILNGLLVLGGGQIFLYQLAKHTPLEKVYVAIIDAVVNIVKKKVKKTEEKYIEE